ncbi:hypothetical protein [Novosphingobium sp.]|uniref:hypothetical protein n=1 Tax=Novosphingobium sp. TaxID=1874826 RepID=UPI0025F3BBDC|nr:hypothetical protein [Novosphingobium sp.]
MFLRTTVAFLIGMVWAMAPLAGADPVRAGHPPAAWPASRLVLFGARWCAPCIAELRDLGPLAIAAHPKGLVLGWIDRPIRTLAAAKGIEAMPPDVALDLAEVIAGRGFGLPLAVMTDDVGRPCAVRHARVLPGDVAAMRAECAKGVAKP